MGNEITILPVSLYQPKSTSRKRSPLILKNNDIGKKITLKSKHPPEKLSFFIWVEDSGYKIDQREISVERSVSPKGAYVYHIPASAIMKGVPIGQKAMFYVKKSGRRSIVLRRTIYRPPQPKLSSNSQLKMDSLYNAIAKDLKSGKPLTASVSIPIWMNDKKNPAKNIYWGKGGGIYRLLRNRKLKNPQPAAKKYYRNPWKFVSEKKTLDQEPQWRAVFKRSVSNYFWRQKGVTTPFDMYLVIRAYSAKNILGAYRAFSKDLFTQNKNRIVGFSGHLEPEGTIIMDSFAQKSSSYPKKGAFVISCLSAQIFSRSVMQRKNTSGLVFSRTLLAAEGYNIIAVLDSITRGESSSQLLNRVYQTYWTYQPPHTGRGTRHLVNQSSKHFYRYSKPFDGDFDKDGIANRIDPDPLKKNSFRFTKANQVKISGQNGQKYTVELTRYSDKKLFKK
ncbi:MAG: hypothetical protein HQ564_06140 [Candidatus Saganbacteria bacterium]|nr:hypothetical protein [Candidatus Saganbacteria bacterium]